MTGTVEPLYTWDGRELHVHHVHECGEVMRFSYSPAVSTACKWTCKCGAKVQLPRTTEANVVGWPR